MTVDQAPRGAVGLERELALLLVADAPRQVRDHLVRRGRLRRLVGAHRVVVDHRVGDLGDPLEVVRGAGRDVAEDDLLRDAAAEQDRHLVDELVARLEVGVLVGKVDDVAERAAARDDRDLVDAVDAGAAQQLAAQRVAGLVVGDDAALALAQGRRGLHAGDDALDGVVEVAARRSPGRRGGRRRSRPRCRCSRGRRPSGRSSAGRRARGRRPRAERLVARVDLEDPRGGR